MNRDGQEAIGYGGVGDICPDWVGSQGIGSQGVLVCVALFGAPS